MHTPTLWPWASRSNRLNFLTDNVWDILLCEKCKFKFELLRLFCMLIFCIFLCAFHLKYRLGFLIFDRDFAIQNFWLRLCSTDYFPWSWCSMRHSQVVSNRWCPAVSLKSIQPKSEREREKTEATILFVFYFDAFGDIIYVSLFVCIFGFAKWSPSVCNVFNAFIPSLFFPPSLGAPHFFWFNPSISYILSSISCTLCCWVRWGFVTFALCRQSNHITFNVRRTEICRMFRSLSNFLLSHIPTTEHLCVFFSFFPDTIEMGHHRNHPWVNFPPVLDLPSWPLRKWASFFNSPSWLYIIPSACLAFNSLLTELAVLEVPTPKAMSKLTNWPEPTSWG